MKGKAAETTTELVFYGVQGEATSEVVKVHVWAGLDDGMLSINLASVMRAPGEPYDGEEWENGCHLSRQDARALHAYIGFLLASTDDA